MEFCKIDPRSPKPIVVSVMKQKYNAEPTVQSSLDPI
jgi:hypothetical protein